MLAYTTIGTNDFEAAKSFYADLFDVIGAKELWATDRFAGFGRKPNEPMFAVCKPFNGEAATAGNGTMIAIGCQSKEQVGQIHAKACELGGSCEGKPGPRGEAGQFYMAYVKDKDGNKLAFYTPNK